MDNPKQSFEYMVKPLASAKRTSFDGQALLWQWAVSFAVVTLIVLGTVGQDYVHITMRRQEDASFWKMIAWPSVWWYGWAFIAPFFFQLAQRYPLNSDTFSRNITVLVLGCVVAFLGHLSLQVASMYLPRFSYIHPDFVDAVEHHTYTSLYLNVFVYWFIVGCAHAFGYYQQARERTLRTAQLESELTKAQLNALKMQIHPHFLFNTLHSISTLMYRDVRSADRMVTHLSDLLRTTLDRSEEHDITLGEEVNFLEKYLRIEKARLGDRLTVQVDIDPAVQQARVPSFVLQPLVENAVKHGIAPYSHQGTIDVHAWAEGGHLCMRVADNGPGLPEGASVLGSGVGLSNLQARLTNLYGDAVVMQFSAAEPQGLVIDLVMPLRMHNVESVPNSAA